MKKGGLKYPFLEIRDFYLWGVENQKKEKKKRGKISQKRISPKRGQGWFQGGKVGGGGM